MLFLTHIYDRAVFHGCTDGIWPARAMLREFVNELEFNRIHTVYALA